MQKPIFVITGIIIFIVFLVASGAIFTVNEYEQVVITQFGKPIGSPIKDAGLHFKVPFIQTANYFDKRILQWDGKRNQIPTNDKRYIWIDTTARWKIVQPLKFLESVTNEIGAQARLDDVISSATRDVITSRDLLEVVRSTDRLENILKEEQLILEVKSPAKDKTLDKSLTEMILERATKDISAYGIELIDVRIKGINYAREVQERVYDRMISERQRAAEKYRSEGQGEKAKIEGKMEKELKRINSEAYKKAQEIKGQADAEAIEIYAKSYSQSPEFYSFLKTLETYKNTVDSATTILLTTDSEYYKYLKKLNVNE